MNAAALLAFATAALGYLSKREENNPRWLKELKKAQDLERRWNEEFNKGEGNRSLHDLDEFEHELHKFQDPIVQYFLSLSK